MKSKHAAALAVAILGAACDHNDDVNDAIAQVRRTEATECNAATFPPAPATLARADIVSDRTGALSQDPRLINAWGLAFNPIGAAWVAAADGHISGVYDAKGGMLLPDVSVPGSPTGTVFNDNPGAFNGDAFLFVTEEGTVVGWQPSNGSDAQVRIAAAAVPASYKGATIASFNGTTRLYAADFRNAKIDVWDSTFTPVGTIGFIDPVLPAGYAPFNVQQVQGKIAVTFALQSAADPTEEQHGPGLGIVDFFDADGRFLSRVASCRAMNAPWGITMTPPDYPAIPDRLLVGNFGDGLINVFRFDGGDVAHFEGQLNGADGKILAIDGLWALRFGVDAGGFSSRVLYFTAGPEDEQHGVFGALAQPGTFP